MNVLGFLSLIINSASELSLFYYHIWLIIILIFKLSLIFLFQTEVVCIDFLIEIQKAFDDDVASGYIVPNGSLKNATSSGRLGYKLIIQTGDNSNPINKKRVSDLA